MVAARSLYSLFACQFGLAVYAERVCSPVFLAWSVAVALEYVVGTDVYQCSADFLHGSCKIAGSRVVYQIGCVVVALRFVYIGICSTVYDYVHIVLLHHVADVLEISDVEFFVAVGYVGEDIVVIA